jgi:glycosyltransferase involved in cell wall biosynthesis
MERLAKTLRLEGVELVGPLTLVSKWREYEAAELFVLPTHSENFGMVIAEALASGVPVITTKAAPWQGVETERCGWWIPDSAKALETALRSACTMKPEHLRGMGLRGKEWMRRAYSWETVADEMRAVCEWLVRGGGVPCSVRRQLPPNP